MKGLISILSIFLIFSFTSLHAEVDGYKDLKFGMTSPQVKKIMERVCNRIKVLENGIAGEKCYKLMGKKRMLVAIIPNVLEEIDVKLQPNVLVPIPKPTWKSLITGVHKKYEYYNEGRLTKSMMVRAYEGGQILTMRDESQGMAMLSYLNKERAENALITLGLKKSDDSEL